MKAKKVLGPERRRIFTFLIGGTVALSLFLLLAIPLADLFGVGLRTVSAIVPFVMFLLTITAVIWLMRDVMSKRTGSRSAANRP